MMRRDCPIHIMTTMMGAEMTPFTFIDGRF
jgi:hypothetical protein